MILPPLEPERPAAIARRSVEQREDDPVDFLALRRLAVRLAQATGGDTWTDYNLHDPGITILEQVCYAMTELAYRADFPVADHLTQADGTIHYARQALFPPEEILPCRPTSAQDYRRMFFDRVPDLGDIRFEQPDPKRLGVQRLRLRLGFHSGHETRVTARSVREAVREAYLAHRGFGEDIEARIRPISLRLCDLKLEAEIEGKRDPLEVAAEIYDKCAAKVAGRVRPHAFDTLLRANMPLEEIFDGPSWEKGVVLAEDVSQGGRLALSELRAEILNNVTGVSAVTSLELKVLAPYGETPRAVLQWDPATTAYRLRVPGMGPDAADTLQITLRRRGVKAPLDPQALARRYADQVRPGRTAHGARAFKAAHPAPVGLHHRPVSYRSVREHFPPVYALLDAERDHVSDEAWPTADTAVDNPSPQIVAAARADQLKAYLAFLDHVLVNGASQLDHVADLFSVDGGHTRDGWRRLLTNDEAPGIARLYLKPRDTVASEVFEDFDDLTRRRNLALDFLLSLHGETLAQNTSRQFLDYLDSRELAVALLANKAEYLRQMICVGRDRAAGFDYGKNLWTRHEHTPGLHRRICLLLGFSSWVARPLTRSLGDWAPVTDWEDPVTGLDDLQLLSWPAAGDGPAAPRRGPPRAGLHGPLFAEGLRRGRYVWRPSGDGEKGALYLACGPVEEDDEDQDDVRPRAESWWKLGNDFPQEDVAAAYAARLRGQLLAATDACEGLHIVEHALLRPRRRPAGFDPSFHALRATLVFPAWTARTSRPGFKEFVRETVAINAPAHVRCDCLFLGFAAMTQFEALYEAWLGALHAAAHGGRLRALDEASIALEDFLRARPPTDAA